MGKRERVTLTAGGRGAAPGPAQGGGAGGARARDRARRGRRPRAGPRARPAPGRRGRRRPGVDRCGGGAGERAHDRAGAPAVRGAGAGGGAAARAVPAAPRARAGRGAGSPSPRPGLRPAARRQGAPVAAPAGRAHVRAGARGRALARDGAPDAQENEPEPHLRKMWCIPPKQSAEFVCHTEDALEVYRRPHGPEHPVVCLGETFTQPIGESREPLPAAPGQVGRYDRVYVRDGTASLSLAFGPLAGWRHVAVTEGRQRGDWARFVAALLEGRHAEAERLVLAMDRLDTHSRASLYEVFPPEQAKRPADRLEVRHTPEHGSRLN